MDTLKGSANLYSLFLREAKVFTLAGLITLLPYGTLMYKLGQMFEFSQNKHITHCWFYSVNTYWELALVHSWWLMHHLTFLPERLRPTCWVHFGEYLWRNLEVLLIHTHGGHVDLISSSSVNSEGHCGEEFLTHGVMTRGVFCVMERQLSTFNH